MSIMSLLIAVGALAVSLTALWKTHFARFSVLGVTGDLRHRIYPISSDKDKWYICSFDVPVAVTNQGARPGIVTGLRLRLEFPDLPIPGNHEILPAKFELRPERAHEVGRERFDWLKHLMCGHWMPFVVLPKATVLKHFVFEVRWNDPVIQPRVNCTLEGETGGGWKRWADWVVTLEPATWSELANRGTSVSYSSEGASQQEVRVPPDLHKYTGTKVALPKNGFGASPSRLAYPEEE